MEYVMTAAGTAWLPAPGWYPDPSNSGNLRWWDGDAWTEHVSTAAHRATPPTAIAPPSMAEYIPMASFTRPAPSAQNLTRSQRDWEIRRNNVMAYVGLVLALISLLINPFAIISILAIIFSGIGVARAQALQGQRVTGRGTAITGLIIGIAGLFLLLWLVSIHVRQLF